MPRIRPLLVVDSLDAGGAERQVVDLALALRDDGHEPVTACSTGGPLVAELRAAGVPVAPLLGRLVKRRFSPPLARSLRRLIRGGGFDVVHAHVYASEGAAAAAVAGTDLPLVLTEHTEGPWRGRRARWISRAAYRRADRIIAVSTAIHRMLVEDFGVPPSKAVYVANGVAGRAATGAALELPADWGDAMLIARICRLQPEKGLDVFLRAAAAVAPAAPQARFLVIGEGPLRCELEALAERLGMADRVRFLGYRPDARALMERLHLLVVSSRTDGAPLVNVEAMQSGVPIVGTAVGGIPDQIRHGVNGLLVPPGDAPALARAIERLAADPAQARRLGEAGRRRCAAEFSFAAMAAAVQATYRQAIARRGAAVG